MFSVIWSKPLLSWRSDTLSSECWYESLWARWESDTQSPRWDDPSGFWWRAVAGIQTSALRSLCQHRRWNMATADTANDGEGEGLRVAQPYTMQKNADVPGMFWSLNLTFTAANNFCSLLFILRRDEEKSTIKAETQSNQHGLKCTLKKNNNILLSKQ